MGKRRSRGAPPTRDRSGLWRSRISGASRAHFRSEASLTGLVALALQRVRDTRAYLSAHTLKQFC